MTAQSTTNSKVVAQIAPDGVTNPTIQNQNTSAIANTETSYALPAGSKRFTITNRGNCIVKLSYSAGTSGITYFSLYPHSPYAEEAIIASLVTLYFQSVGINQRLEIISWT